MPLGVAQVRIRARNPGSRIGKLPIAQVPGRKFRAVRGAVAPVEAHDRRCDRVARRSAKATDEFGGETGASQAFDFQGQEGNLLDRVQPAQRAAELEAVDDAGRRREADMLGAQVAMAVDEPRATGPDQAPRPFQELPLKSHHGTGPSPTTPPAGNPGRAPIFHDLARQPPDIPPGRHGRALGAAEKTGQHGDQALDLHGAQDTLREYAVEHARGRQAPHLDEPLDDDALLLQRQSAAAHCERDDRQIHLAR
jgi:hypothetical protein